MRMFCSLATIKSLYYPGKRPQTVWGGVKGSCIIYIYNVDDDVNVADVVDDDDEDDDDDGADGG